MATLDTLLSTLPESPSERGRAFERLSKWYLEHNPTDSMRRVWLWDDWPGRWGRDAGIDLVAETHDGELWAIQAKAYAPTTSITKQDVDSFLSESARDVFAFRLLLATTDQMGPNARQVFAGQSIRAGYRLLNTLAAERMDWPESFTDLRAPKRPAAKPRPHQVDALDAITRGLADGGRARVVMACGTGKTFVQLWTHERLESRRTLVLLPSLFLVQQSLSEWTANRVRPFEFLAVCSDETVVDRDSLVADVTELGVPVTTDATHIRAFLEREGDRVIFCTYQSSGQIAKAVRGTSIRFDLVVADEAHRLAGDVSRDYATVLRDDEIPAQRRAFFTATPRYISGNVEGVGDESDLEIASMDDAEVFGPEIHRLSFGEAIRLKLLSDYRVVVVGVSDAEVHRLAETGATVAFDGKTTDARSLARQIGLAKAMHDYNLRRVISFHSRVNLARDFATALADIVPRLPTERSPQGELIFDHVSGDMPAGDRRKRINRLRDVSDTQYALLANARCLSEGVDVPSLDGVAFIDPRRSQIDIVQAVGRAIRLSAGKTLGTVVIPVLIPEGADDETVLSDSCFEPVWAVVRALRDHDDDLAERLDAARGRLGLERKLTIADLPPKIVIDLPVGVVGASFVEAFTTRVVESATSSWEEAFARLQEFVARAGHARVPQSFRTDDGVMLGRWASKQRGAHRKGRLSPDRTVRLVRLPGWTWDALDEKWERGFASLRTFVAREEHTHVPPGFRDDTDYPLGNWVGNQRAAYRDSTLSAHRIAQLETVAGWVWSTLDDQWESGFAQLEAFVARGRHARVPQSFRTSEDFQLGAWLATQRVAQRKRRLSAERVARFEALPGWTWDPLDDQWESAFARLEEFVADAGHAKVPDKRDLVDGFGLGTWVGAQRAAYGRGGLSAERIARLEALPGWVWDPTGEAWDFALAKLHAFAARERHTTVPTDFKTDDGFTLGRWLRHQRALYVSHRLSAERVARLEAVPGWTGDPSQEQWESGFAQLRAFVAREQHARVPATFRTVDDFQLGGWVRRQRQVHGKGALSAEHVARFETLPGWAWDRHDDQWESGFAQLQAYVTELGHANVPAKFQAGGRIRLGSWVTSRRVDYRKGKLSAERIARLEALPGWVWSAK